MHKRATLDEASTAPGPLDTFTVSTPGERKAALFVGMSFPEFGKGILQHMNEMSQAQNLNQKESKP